MKSELSYNVEFLFTKKNIKKKRKRRRFRFFRLSFSIFDVSLFVAYMWVTRFIILPCAVSFHLRCSSCISQFFPLLFLLPDVHASLSIRILRHSRMTTLCKNCFFHGNKNVEKSHACNMT